MTGQELERFFSINPERLPRSPLPKVKIISISTLPEPYDLPDNVTPEQWREIMTSSRVLAGEAARTCYSSTGLNEPIEYLNPGHKRVTDGVVESTRLAGHLTTREHFHITYGISNISRQVLEDFFHAHPFYDTEQVSQRYVEVKAGLSFIPPLEGRDYDIYVNSQKEQMAAYYELKELLKPQAAEAFYALFPARKGNPKYEKADASIIEKKAQEVARYVLGVDTFAYEYHTVSALTLMRYVRICNACDVPLEAKLVVKGMVDALLEKDPEFYKELMGQIPQDKLPEWLFLGQNSLQENLDYKEAKRFCEEFDYELDGYSSKVSDYMFNAEKTLAKAVRNVVGVAKTQLPDNDAISFILDPKQNKVLAETLNVTTMHKPSQALHVVSYTFDKKISHTGDSQDQRHRMVPAARPYLAAQYSGEPDYIIPNLIKRNPQALALYERTMKHSFEAINALIERGVPPEYALYRLPNAFPIRYTETGNLLYLWHKYKARLCYNAQDEIWRTSQEEVSQITGIHPEIGKHLQAPCGMRKAANTTPYCPEGPRFCGQTIWQRKPENYPERII